MFKNINELKEMAKQQAKTDKEMCKTHDLDMNSKEWFDNRIIALTVEFVETLQVTEKFKDWKINKGKIDPKRFMPVFQDDGMNSTIVFYEDILKEYEEISKDEALKRTLIEECADSLHFVLSLINHFDYKGKISFYDNVDMNQCVVNCLYELMAVQQSYVLSCYRFDGYTKEHFRVFINYLFSYFELIGITKDELEQAYWLKNKVNHKRIKEGY